MSENARLSVLLITLDADRLLDQVLSSVQWADEIVIVDSGSADRTAEIARRYTDHFHVRSYQGHGRMRQLSLELSSGDWILYVDSDEVVTPELQRSIQQAVADPGRFAAFQMELHTEFLGAWFGKRGWKKEWKTRLFRRDSGEFDDRRIHEGARIRGPIGTLGGVIEHHPYRDIQHAREKMDDYADKGAEILKQDGRRASRPGAVARGLTRFLRDYILGGDFLYGIAGFRRAQLMGYYTWRKYRLLAD